MKYETRKQFFGCLLTVAGRHKAHFPIILFFKTPWTTRRRLTERAWLFDMFLNCITLSRVAIVKNIHSLLGREKLEKKQMKMITVREKVSKIFCMCLFIVQLSFVLLNQLFIIYYIRLRVNSSLPTLVLPNLMYAHQIWSLNASAFFIWTNVWTFWVWRSPYYWRPVPNLQISLLTVRRHDFPMLSRGNSEQNPTRVTENLEHSDFFFRFSPRQLR